MKKRNHVANNLLLVVVLLLVVTQNHGGLAFLATQQYASISSRLVEGPRKQTTASSSSTTTSSLFVANEPTVPCYFMEENEPPKKKSEPSPVVTAGDSPKAVKLRKELQQVWTSNKTSPVLLVGSHGSGKGTLVNELLARLPDQQKVNIHRLSMDDAANYCETMLGSENEPGLLDFMADDVNCTLVLKSFQSRTVQSADELGRRKELFEAIAKLVTQRSFYSRYEGKERPFAPRIIATCSHRPDFVNDQADMFVINVPSLESRLKDMEAIATSKLKLLEPQYGLDSVQLSTQATHRLLDHRWEIVESELDEALSNALALLSKEKQKHPKAPTTLASKHMFFNTFDESTRHRLLYEYPLLRKIIQSPWIFDHTLRYIVAPVFVVVLAILFLGPQTRDHNAALTIFWAGWWPAVMLVYPFLGRIWCSVCPFMAVGNLAQETVTRFGVKLKKWPKWGSTIGAAFAFGLFFAILMWEELWNLPQNGALSAWLLLLITSGAVFNSVQFENRMWCRYLCPIGAMCRTFGTISMVEVRSWKANCEGCANPVCVKGNSPTLDPTDTFAIKGCTMQLKNNQLRDMGDCTLCMSCVKNCEREVPEVNTRPIGLDFGLPFLLPPALQKPENMPMSQGSVLVHYMPKLLSDLGMDPAIATAGPALDMPFLEHTVITAGLLALPGLLSLAADKISKPLESFIQVKWGNEEESAEQEVVVDLYESIMKSDRSIKDTLSEFDPDGDGIISCWECKQALQGLHIPEGQCETLMTLMKRRFGDVDTLSIASWLDYFQELYTTAKERQFDKKNEQKPRSTWQGNELQSKKTFVEIFNDLDKDGDGFISEKELS
eukprot:scaffold5254_cov165-Amphora_coffeaeformis.AAC.3